MLPDEDPEDEDDEPVVPELELEGADEEDDGGAVVVADVEPEEEVADPEEDEESVAELFPVEVVDAPVECGLASDAGSVVTGMLVPGMPVPFGSFGFWIEKMGPQLLLEPRTAHHKWTRYYSAFWGQEEDEEAQRTDEEIVLRTRHERDDDVYLLLCVREVRRKRL